MRLSQFDPAGSRYSILKPGQHFPSKGITRHIGSQVRTCTRAGSHMYYTGMGRVAGW